MYEPAAVYPLHDACDFSDDANAGAQIDQAGPCPPFQSITLHHLAAVEGLPVMLSDHVQRRDTDRRAARKNRENLGLSQESLGLYLPVWSGCKRQNLNSHA